MTAQPALSAAAVSPAVHESVLQRTAGAPAKKSSAALPLAIAAIVLLGLGAGAWAFRAQIPFLQQWTQTTQVAQTTTTTSAPLAAATTPTTPVPPPSAPATATAAPAVASTTAPLPPATPAAGNTAAAAQVGATSGTAAATSATTIAASSASPATPAAGAPDGTPPTAAQLAAATDNSGPAPRASQVEPLKQLAAAQAAGAAVQAQTPAQQQIARVTPPPPVAEPPRPHVPTIAVLSGGDIRVSEPAARVIEQALSHHGYRLLDSEMMPHTERFLGDQRNNVAGLLELLAKGGRVDAVVIVHARDAGAQNINFYGQSDTMTSAQLNVNVYSVSNQHKLGPGWSEDVHFTGMSARNQAQEAVQEIAPQVEGLLTEYRPGRNRG